MKIHRAFTLSEVLLSTAITIVIFTLVVQAYFMLIKSARIIELNRELNLHTSQVINTLGTDMDELILDPRNISATEATLFPSTDTPTTPSFRVTYRISESPALFDGSIYDTSVLGGATPQLLERESYETSTGDTERQHLSKLPFALTNIHFIPTPRNFDTRNAELCNLPPSITIAGTITYIPKKGDHLRASTNIQTTFSTPMDPIAYKRLCMNYFYTK